MPHEHIYSPEHRDGSYGVRIGWMTGQSHAEPADFSPGEVHIGSGDLTHEGLPVGDEPPKIFFAALDRAGVNRLIRTLRRARDAAFGADA